MNVNMNFLQDLLSSIGRRTRGQHLVGSEDGGTPSSLARLTSVCETLMQPGGEASQILIAQEALERYASLGESDRLAFFQLLGERYAAEPDAIHEVYAAYRDNGDNASGYIGDTTAPASEAVPQRRQRRIQRKWQQQWQRQRQRQVRR